MERRVFLKRAAMSLATAAAVKGASAETKSDVLPSIEGVNWNKAPCRFCGTGCHVQVGVKAGKVVAIAGDDQAEVNRGLLCVKGYHVGLALYGEDRLTQPMLRDGDTFKPISWQRAIDIIADRVEQDPKGFAVYGSGQWTIPGKRHQLDYRPHNRRPA